MADTPFVLEGRLFPEGVPARVEVTDGRVRAVLSIPHAQEDPGEERWIVPGFFDLQVNGFAGRSFAAPDLTIADVEHITRAVLNTGVTRLFPTVVTAPIDLLCRQVATIVQAIDDNPQVRQMCPGIHIEGPFIHPEDGPRGAHRREFVRDPNISEFEQIWEAGAGRIAMITLAPERPGGIDLIRHAAERGVVVALGHHRATPEILRQAVEAGAKISTHLGNGADAVLPRQAGNYIWEQLAEDRLWASFIADGHHLPAPTLRCMLRAKGLERSVLVTDAIELAGLAPGRYPRRGSEVELTPDGRVTLVGTPYLAGSSASMPVVISHAMIDGGLTLPEAVRLATLQPQLLMGVQVLSPICCAGESANLLEISWQPQSGLLQVNRIASGNMIRTFSKQV